jgi:outer membrane protein, heavy metal efflux system
MMKLKAIFIMTLIGLCGCATFHSERLSPEKVAAGFEARTLESPELRKFIESKQQREVSHWPPVSWDFNMLALAAAYYSPALDVMRARWGVAEAAVITAGGHPNPSVSSFGQHHSSTPGGISPWTWGISLDIPIETAGKRGYRIRKAKQLSEAARLAIAETSWQVWSGLKKSLLDLYAATNEDSYLLKRISIQRRITRLFEERLAVGEASQFEVTQSRLALDNMRLLLADNQKKKAEARSALAKAIGLQVKALGGIQISFDLFEQMPETIDIRSMRRKALLGRPDILAALQEYEASQSALKLEIAKQYPDIRLGPAYEWDQGDNKWSLGFSIELPVFNRNRGPIEEAGARRKEFAAKFMSIQAGIIGQIDRAEAVYNSSLKSLQTAATLLSAENTQMQAVKARFDSGETDRLDLEQARMELSSAELSRFVAVVSAQRDMGNLEDAVRQPLYWGEAYPSSPEKSARGETIK